MKSFTPKTYEYHVFLNYPFDSDFTDLSYALQFSVVAAGLLPLCAKDISYSDQPRLVTLVDSISHCRYSIHDFSRSRGEGADNFARMNMPIEMGMALFHALNTQHRDHRCLFFVNNPYDYHKFASDLAGLDPICHENNELQLVAHTYDWLRDVAGTDPSIKYTFNLQPTTEIQAKYCEFKEQSKGIWGSGKGGEPSHREIRELMYQVCAECRWWEWRDNKVFSALFPSIPLSRKSH